MTKKEMLENARKVMAANRKKMEPYMDARGYLKPEYRRPRGAK